MISRAQAEAIGLSPRQVEWCVRTGRWHRIHRGVYAIGHDRLTHHGRYMAAALATAALPTRRSAASIWSVQPHHAGPVHLVSTTKQRSRPGIVMHWTRELAAADVRTRQGIPVTSLARTLLDLADVASPAEQEEALRAAERIHGFDRATLTRVHGRRGTGRVQGTAELTRGHLEALFLRVLDEAGLRRPVLNVRCFEYVLDAVWWEARVAAEIDDWDSHRTRASFTADRRRDRFVTRTGLRPIRITHDDLTRGRDALLDDLRALGVSPAEPGSAPPAPARPAASGRPGARARP